jgi:NADH-quinone oxidoreductase subunit H
MEWLSVKSALLMAAILLVFPLVVGYIVLLERKVLADIQVRLGPMRVGPFGLLQPLADALKLLIKEDVVPQAADRPIFWLAPVVSVAAGLTSFVVLPFSPVLYITDVNVGLLVVVSMASVGILGIILGGWSSNSHYSLLGALRSAAQLVSYEVAFGLALLSGVLAAGSLSLVEIVRAQQERGVWFLFANYGLMVPTFLVYFIASVAETNRTPFDLPEAESELVAGFHTEYSGFRWALYMLAEYANMFVTSSVAVVLFLGGWLRPFPNVGWLEIPVGYGGPLALLAGAGLGCLYLRRKVRLRWERSFMASLGALLCVSGLSFLHPAVNHLAGPVFWFLLKVFLLLYVLIWFRGTFPRFRYDQLMDIGWKRLIPLGLGCLVANACVGLMAA